MPASVLANSALGKLLSCFEELEPGQDIAHNSSAVFPLLCCFLDKMFLLFKDSSCISWKM